MQAFKDYLVQNWYTLATPVAVFLIVVIAGWFVRRILFRTLDAWTAKTTTRFDNLVIGTLHGPFMVWTLILGLHLAAQLSALPPRATAVIGKFLLVLWIISATLVASRLAALFVRQYGGGFTSAMRVTTLTQNLASLVVVVFGALILLNSLGVSI